MVNPVAMENVYGTTVMVLFVHRARPVWVTFKVHNVLVLGLKRKSYLPVWT
jgi:hypothetical protein